MAALDGDVEALDVEIVRHAAEHAAGEELEGGAGALIGIADRLPLLDLAEERVEAAVVPLDAEPQAGELGNNIGLPRLVGDEEVAPVADRLRRDVLVGPRVLDDGRGVDAGLGGEGARPDIGRLPVGGAVDQLVEAPGDAGEARKALGRDADPEALGIGRLQHEGRDDRGEVGIAAALADAVQRALDLAGAGAHGGERVRHRLLGVVMGVDAEMIAGDGLGDLADDGLDLLRQRAAVGVAEHDPAGAGVVSRAGASEGIGRVRLVAVEEVLGVEEHLAPRRPRRRDRLADGFQVLLLGRAEGDADVIVPGLRDEADGIGLRVEEGAEAGVVRQAHPCPLGHAEGGEYGPARPLRLEEGGVGRVGAGIAALDIVDAELVEELRDGDLVLEREVDAARLRAVAQGRVEEIETLFTHVGLQAAGGQASVSWSGCWWLVRRILAASAGSSSSVDLSPGRPGSAANHERRDSTPYCFAGFTFSGSSSEPRENDIRGEPASWIVSGVPQFRQKPRSVSPELMNTARVPRVSSKASTGTPANGAKNEPKAFWHMRQWQIWGLVGDAWSA